MLKSLSPGMMLIIIGVLIKIKNQSKSICNDCGYKDDKGEFEMTNKSLYRENKINQILDELQ